METRNSEEDYIKIRASDFGLIQSKYMLSQKEISYLGIDVIKQDMAIKIGRYLLSEGLLGFEKEGNILIASLYVVKPTKGGAK